MDSLRTHTELTNVITADEIAHTVETGELSPDVSTQETKEVGVKDREEDTVIGIDEPAKIICEPCLFDEVETTAVAFCVICVEFLCTDCARDHRRSKVTRQHKLLSDGDMPTSSAVFKMMKELASCPNHPDMVASYECLEHKTFICSTCVAVNHRKCDNVTEVSKCAAAAENSCTESLLEDRLRLLIEKTVEVRMAKEENISSLLVEQTEVNTERTMFKDKIAQHIQDLCELSESEMKALLSTEITAIKQDVERCKALEVEEKQKQELLQTTLQHGNLVERSIASNRILNDLQRYEQEAESQNAKKKVRLDFTANTIFLDQSPLCYISAKKGTKLESLDRVSHIQMEHSSDTCDKESNAASTHQISESGKSEHKAGKDINRGFLERKIGRTVTKYDTEAQTDIWKCTVDSILILSDGRVVIIDECNKVLKVLGADYSVQITRDLEHGPIDMCEVSDNVLAVVFQSFKYVQRYIITDQTISEDGGFLTKLHALSISTFKPEDSTVAILFSDEQLDTDKNTKNDTIEVQVRNYNNGKVICTLSDFKSKLSKQMTISNPIRICVVGKATKRMLISAENTLHCFEIDGSTLKEVWFYKSYGDVPVDDISDVTTDSDDNVYIVCSKSHNLHQISSTNFRTNRVLTSKLCRPFSICLDKTGTQILVGCSEDGYLDVFQFM